MDMLNNEIVSALSYLLPGFVASWIYYGLTAHPKPSPFERVVGALIFTALIQLVVYPIETLALFVGTLARPIGVWDERTTLVVSVAIALIFGFIFSWFGNTSTIHNRLPNWITKRTSYPSEWYGVFHNFERYVYLHLKGGKRLYGWPSEFPDQPDEGHFALMQPAWILDDNQRVPLYLVERMLIPAKEVVMVEFEKPETEWTHDAQEQKKAESVLIELQTGNPMEAKSD